ncbi:ABC transporter permease [Microbacteriaceae bacterium VKM Ac-2854]|nr:ABC transporter permease [Microbacteriaceae bacterium VKM Ac-2854]
MNEFLRDRRVRIGIGIWLFFLVFAFLGPVILTALGRDASDVDFDALGVGPSAQHWLGTTNTGEDVLNQLVFGAQGSVLTGILVGLFATAIATAVGLIGAYLGGVVDSTLNGLSNLALTVSGFPLLVVIAAYIPKVGLLGIAIVISLVSWAGGARNIRSQVLSLRKREYIVAMRMAGEKPSRLMVAEVMPHLLPVISSTAIACFSGGVLSEAGLRFIGLGGGSVSWGTMISEVQQAGAIAQGQWWWFVPPGLSIVLLGMGLALINFGIDAIANPRLRGLDPRILRKATAAAKRIQQGEARDLGVSA